MNRKDREITNKNKIDSIIESSDILHLGLCMDNKPYVVPLNFGYDGKSFFIHSAIKGKKIDYITENQEVCFELTASSKIISGDIACKWTCEFSSVIGYGKASFVENKQDKIYALNQIMKKYSGKESFEYSENHLNSVVIIKINIDEITGKSNIKF